MSSAESKASGLGRYRLYDQVASGGMASVHIARLNAQVGFSRTVAVKRLHRHLAANPDFVMMFVDEARLVARIRHANVVPTIDIVVHESEVFLVMEFVQGVSLAKLMTRLQQQELLMPLDIASAIVVGTLRGLQAAHDATTEQGQPLNIVHRDISPHNVMVGADGLARVLDFGIAKASERLQDTRDGVVKGKLAYIAPEQLDGGVVGPWTDVFATGVVFWETVTAQRLFAKAGQAAHLRFVQPSPLPSAAALVPNLPSWVDQVLFRALSVAPSDRFASAHDMAEAIEAHTHVASPSRIASWLRSVVSAELDVSAALVASVEGRAAEGRGPRSRRSRPSHPAPSTKSDEQGRTGNEMVRTAVPESETARLTAVGQAASASPVSRRRAVLIGTAVVSCLLLLAGFTRFLKPAAEGAALEAASSPPVAGASPRSVPATGEPKLDTYDETTTLPPVVAATATAQPSSLAPSDAPSAPAVRTSSQRKPVVSKKTAPAPAPQADSRCTPPYLVDSRGIRYIKPACVKP